MAAFGRNRKYAESVTIYIFGVETEIRSIFNWWHYRLTIFQRGQLPLPADVHACSWLMWWNWQCGRRRKHVCRHRGLYDCARGICTRIYKDTLCLLYPLPQLYSACSCRNQWHCVHYIVGTENRRWCCEPKISLFCCAPETCRPRLPQNIRRIWSTSAWHTHIRQRWE